MRFAAVAMAVGVLAGIALILVGRAEHEFWFTLAGTIALGLTPLWLLRPLLASSASDRRGRGPDDANDRP